jgi:hypothetical protein
MGGDCYSYYTCIINPNFKLLTMLYSDLNYAAQKQADLNILARFDNNEAMLAEVIASNYFLFDMDGEIIEENDNY